MIMIYAALLVAVSAGKDKAIHLYELNPRTGALVQRAKIDLPGAPGSQFVSPDGNRLYVSVRTANSVAAYRINHAKKTLVPLGITNIEANAAYVATDRSGRTLLWASYSGGVVGSHAINKNGSVKSGPLVASQPPDVRMRFYPMPRINLPLCLIPARMRFINFASTPRPASSLRTIL